MKSLLKAAGSRRRSNMEEEVPEISETKVQIHLDKDKNYVKLKREREMKRPKRFISEVDSLFVVGEYPQGSRTTTKHNIVEVCSKNNVFAEFDDKEDTVKSGESLFKVYSFEPKKNNPNLEKCIAFWNSISSMEDLEPVDCSLRISKEEPVEEKKQEEEECKCPSPWLTILMAMKRRNLDKVALAAIPMKCEFCRHEHNTIEPNYTITDDVLSLNTWVPKSNWVDPRIIRRQKEEQKKLAKMKEEEAKKVIEEEMLDEEKKYTETMSYTPSNLYFNSEEKLFASSTTFQSVKIPFEALEEVCPCGIPNCDCRFRLSLLDESRSKLSLIVEEPEEKDQVAVVEYGEESAKEESKSEREEKRKHQGKMTQNKQIQVPTPDLDKTTPKESYLCLLCGEKNCQCKKEQKKIQLPLSSSMNIIQTLEGQARKIIEYILFGNIDETNNFDIPKEYELKTNLTELTEKTFEKYQNLYDGLSDQINYDALEMCVKDIVMEVFKSEEGGSDDSNSLLYCSQKSSVKFNSETLEIIKEVPHISQILKTSTSVAEAQDKTESAHKKPLVYIPKLPKKKVKEYTEPGRKL